MSYTIIHKLIDKVTGAEVKRFGPDELREAILERERIERETGVRYTVRTSTVDQRPTDPLSTLSTA